MNIKLNITDREKHDLIIDELNRFYRNALKIGLPKYDRHLMDNIAENILRKGIVLLIDKDVANELSNKTDLPANEKIAEITSYTKQGLIAHLKQEKLR